MNDQAQADAIEAHWKELLEGEERRRTRLWIALLIILVILLVLSHVMGLLRAIA